MNEKIASLIQIFGSLFKECGRSCTHFIFPSLCLHCHTPLTPSPLVVCGDCAQELHLIDVKSRCLICFDTLDDERRICLKCRKEPSPLHRTAAAFDYEGVPSSLVRKFKYGKSPHLSQGMAGFMLAQWEILKWPEMDVITFVPLSFVKWTERGYNQSELLAQEMGKMLNRPVVNTLKRRSGDFSQASLPLEMRKKLPSNSFLKRKGISIEGKKVLLIDDVNTSGSTLRQCAEVLLDGNPSVIYALTFCRA